LQEVVVSSTKQALVASEEWMISRDDQSQHWRGKKIEVRIPYSRAGVAQHIWLEAGSSSLLIDTGDGVVRDLLREGLDLVKLSALLFTHGHFDHMGGLHSLLGFLRMVGRKETLPILTPEGCVEVSSIVEGFTTCYADTLPFEISLRWIQPDENLQIGDLEIRAFPMVHCGGIEGLGILDPIPAMGYRISHQRETVAITGDCGSASPLRELVEGADLAIIEATYKSNANADKESLEKVHLSEDLAEEMGKLARQFILVHKGNSDG
jgi:phosphoribosyl 1,2-cyclic phosphate phosphodiesterase